MKPTVTLDQLQVGQIVIKHDVMSSDKHYTVSRALLDIWSDDWFDDARFTIVDDTETPHPEQLGHSMNKHVRICIECDHHRISDTGMHLCSANAREFVEFDLVTGEFVEKVITCREMRMPGASCGISGELFDAKG